MKNTLLLLTFLAMFTAMTPMRSEPIPSVPPSSVGLSSEGLAKIDGVVEKLLVDGKLSGCVVAVARHGKIAYLKAFGERDAESGEPMQEDTIFRIYSHDQGHHQCGRVDAGG